MMKNLILILAFCVSSLAMASELKGSTIAKKWLGIVDAGNYGESWQKSDSFFRTQLTKEKWDAALKAIREPLGQVKSRSELGVKAYSSLPGVPEGEYLVLQFQTEFQNRKSATETLVLSKSSGDWLPVGYSIN